jgi:hypothetical protein
VLLVPVDDVEDVSLVDEDDEPSSEIRLCRLDASLPGPPTALAASVESLADDELLLCACKAAIKFCRKLPIACAALVVPEALLESELVELLDVPVLLESLVPVTPIWDKALAMASIKPPLALPLPCGVGGMPPMAFPESLPLDCVLIPHCDVK